MKSPLTAPGEPVVYASCFPHVLPSGILQNCLITRLTCHSKHTGRCVCANPIDNLATHSNELLLFIEQCEGSASLCFHANMTFFDCSLLNSNTCSAEHPSLSNEQQLGQSKTRLVPMTGPPVLSPGAPQPPLHLPIITIPILITASDFIGALAAGKRPCSVLDAAIFQLLLVQHLIKQQ